MVDRETFERVEEMVANFVKVGVKRGYIDDGYEIDERNITIVGYVDLGYLKLRFLYTGTEKGCGVISFDLFVHEAVKVEVDNKEGTLDCVLSFVVDDWRIISKWAFGEDVPEELLDCYEDEQDD